MIFWLATSASSLLLAILANIDRWRADWIPSATESWLNLLLTAAWACLAALAVFRKRGNKWLFVLLAIHVPALLADLYILLARGFPILPNLPGCSSSRRFFSRPLPCPPSPSRPWSRASRTSCSR